MESTHSINVTRREFNRLRPLMMDADGAPLPEDVLAEAVDAYGWLEVQGEDRNKIKIMVAYDKGD